MSRTTQKRTTTQKNAQTKVKIYSKELRQAQKLAPQGKPGKIATKHSQTHKKTTMQFKSSTPRVQSRPKKATGQFKSPAATIRSNVSMSAAQVRSATLVTSPAQPQVIIEQPTMPQTTIEQPAILLAVTAQEKQEIQTPAKSTSMTTHPPRVAFRIFAICLAAIAVCVNFSNYSSLIPTLHSALGIDDGQVGLFSTLLFLGIIISNVPGGILADRFGPRKVVLVALSFTTAGSLLFPIFPNFIWMVACRALIGLGAGATLVACSQACAQLGKYEPLGQGLNGGTAQLGVGLGLLSMTFLQGLLGWRSALFVCGILGVVALIAWLWYPKEVRSADREDQLAEKPAIAIRTPAIWALGLANMGTFGLADAIMAWISVYFIREYGLPLAFAGGLGGAALFAGVLFQPLGGLLLARFKNPVLLIRSGTVMCFLSVVALALPFHAFPLAIIGLILFAVGTTLPYAAIFSTASMVGKMSGAGAGISQALVAILASLAAVAGAPLIGLQLENTGSFTTALVSVALIFPTIAITASLFLELALKSIQGKRLALNIQ